MGAVTDYLAGLDGDERAAVARVIDRARALVPDAEEGSSYGMATLLPRPVAKTHVGRYRFSPAVIEALADDLAGFGPSQGAIRLRPDHQVEDAVFDRMVLARRDEIAARH